MPEKGGRLTEQETAFIAEMTRVGDPVKAAELAGYAHPRQAAHKLNARPEIVRAVWEATELVLRGEGAAVGVGTLIEIARDEKAPKNARVAAAGHLVKLNGYGEAIGASGSAKPLSEMTRAELAEARARAVLYLDELQRGGTTIEGEAVALPAPDVSSGGLFD
jgi:hypothetical protein